MSPYNDYNTKHVDQVNKLRVLLSRRWHITYMPHIEKTTVVDKQGEIPAQHFETWADFENWAKQMVGD